MPWTSRWHNQSLPLNTKYFSNTRYCKEFHTKYFSSNDASVNEIPCLSSLSSCLLRRLNFTMNFEFSMPTYHVMAFYGCSTKTNIDWRMIRHKDKCHRWNKPASAKVQNQMCSICSLLDDVFLLSVIISVFVCWCHRHVAAVLDPAAETTPPAARCLCTYLPV